MCVVKMEKECHLKQKPATATANLPGIAEVYLR